MSALIAATAIKAMISEYSTRVCPRLLSLDDFFFNGILGAGSMPAAPLHLESSDIEAMLWGTWMEIKENRKFQLIDRTGFTRVCHFVPAHGMGATPME